MALVVLWWCKLPSKKICHARRSYLSEMRDSTFQRVPVSDCDAATDRLRCVAMHSERRADWLVQRRATI